MATNYKPGEPYKTIEEFMANQNELVFVISWKAVRHKAFFISWPLRLAYDWVIQKKLIVRAIKKNNEEK